ncbi:MAG: hypothetical protein AAF529_22785 [Pseudomonadota bacterium]
MSNFPRNRRRPQGVAKAYRFPIVCVMIAFGLALAVTTSISIGLAL